MRRRFILGAALLLGLALPASAEETIGTFTLDGLSYISFGDEQVLLPASGSTLRFRFGTPAPDGTVPFTIEPGDVSIAPVPLPDGRGTLRYGLVGTASGTMAPGSEGRTLQFTATVRATLDSPSVKGSFDYTIPFTTEAAAASDLAGTKTLSVEGMHLVEGIWYGQLVGATTNKANAFPEPGAAVYTVLSGQFDQVP